MRILHERPVSLELKIISIEKMGGARRDEGIREMGNNLYCSCQEKGSIAEVRPDIKRLHIVLGHVAFLNETVLFKRFSVKCHS